MGHRRAPPGRSRPSPRLAGLTREAATRSSAASSPRPNGDIQSQIAISAFGATILIVFRRSSYPSPKSNLPCEKCGLSLMAYRFVDAVQKQLLRVKHLASSHGIMRVVADSLPSNGPPVRS